MFVVTLPISASQNPKEYALKAQAEGADILEIRTDLTPDINPFESALPIMVSVRGNNASNLMSLNPSYKDLELEDDYKPLDDAILIRSFHDYEKTPLLHELKSIADKLMAKGADIIKIVTTIRTYDDVSILDDLHNLLPKNQKRIILGMGPRANITRMLSPLKNELTYTYIDNGEEVTNGQVSLYIHKLTSHCKNPKLYGILGSMQIISLSPLIQNTFFSNQKFDGMFVAMPTDNLEDAWKYIQKTNMHGMAITSPWKNKILPFLDSLNVQAKELGTVNTITKEKNKWIGSTCDSEGIKNGYPFLGNAQSIAILGSGGVVPAIIACCKEIGIDDIRIFARNKNARTALKQQFYIEEFSLENLLTFQPDVLFCAITEDQSFAISKAKVGAHAIDLRYGKETQFLKDASEKGYIALDGIDMLLNQATEQCLLFTGKRPTYEVVDLLRKFIISSPQKI